MNKLHEDFLLQAWIGQTCGMASHVPHVFIGSLGISPVFFILGFLLFSSNVGCPAYSALMLSMACSRHRLLTKT